MMDFIKYLTVLEKKGGWLSRSNLAQRLNAIEKLSEIGDRNLICSLVPFLKDEYREIQIATSNAISILFGSSVARNRNYESFKYCDISVSDIDFYRSAFRDDEYITLLLIASSNLNGYVREKAVRELGFSDDERGIEFIFYRLGDWVPQVRKAASQAIEKFKTAEHIDAFVGNLQNLDRLLHVERVDLTQIYDSLIRFLITENGDYVRKNFRSYPDKNRWLLARHISKGPTSASDLDLFFKDVNPLIRVFAVDHIEDLSEEDIKRLLNDRSSRVRLQLLYKLKSQHNFLEILRPFLADASASIRQFARFYLKDKVTNFAEYYADNLKNGAAIMASLAGLAEVGGKEFTKHVEKYLDHSQVGIKKTAFLALTKLDKQKATDLAITNLDSELRGYRKISAIFLGKNVTPDVVAKAREIFRFGGLGLKTEMLTLFNRIGSWAAISDIILATIDENEDIRELAVKYLSLWKMKSVRIFTRPSSVELEHIRKSLDFAFHEHERRGYFKRNPVDGFEFYLK